MKHQRCGLARSHPANNRCSLPAVLLPAWLWKVLSLSIHPRGEKMQLESYQLYCLPLTHSYLGSIPYFRRAVLLVKQSRKQFCKTLLLVLTSRGLAF